MVRVTAVVMVTAMVTVMVNGAGARQCFRIGTDACRSCVGAFGAVRDFTLSVLASPPSFEG